MPNIIKHMIKCLTNLTVSTEVLAGSLLGMILLTFILIVVVSVCIKRVIVHRQQRKKYISNPHNNCDNNLRLKYSYFEYRIAKSKSDETRDHHAEGNVWFCTCLQQQCMD